MPFGMQLVGSLPAAELKQSCTDNGTLEPQPRYSSFGTAESIKTAALTVKVNPLNSDQTDADNMKSPSLIEKGKLKRVANSFCVQVPASEFVMNPVRSLFSSFIASENESQSNTNNISSA